MIDVLDGDGDRKISETEFIESFKLIVLLDKIFQVRVWWGANQLIL